VPYGALKSQPAKFIVKKYLPAGMMMGDPHNLRKEQVKEFLSHVLARQQDEGAEKAFQFRQYQDGHQKFHRAVYPSHDRPDTMQARAGNPTTKRGKRGRQTDGEASSVGRGTGQNIALTGIGTD
jgi:hypothetical protein